MRNHPVVFTALASFLSLACGKGVIEPATPDLSGDWQYTAALSVPEPLVCQILDGTVTLAQRGLVLDGVMNGVTLACGVSPDTVTLSNLELTEGVVRGDSLSFRFNTLAGQWSHRGRVMDDSLGGVVTVLGPCDPGPCRLDNGLTGTWGARRDRCAGEQVNEHAHADLADDGVSRLALVAPGEAGELIVVENFFEGSKANVGN